MNKKLTLLFGTLTISLSAPAFAQAEDMSCSSDNGKDQVILIQSTGIKAATMKEMPTVDLVVRSGWVRKSVKDVAGPGITDLDVADIHQESLMSLNDVTIASLIANPEALKKLILQTARVRKQGTDGLEKNLDDNNYMWKSLMRFCKDPNQYR